MDNNIYTEHFIRNNSSLGQNQPAINSSSIDNSSIVESQGNVNNKNENFNAPSPALNPQNTNQYQTYSGKNPPQSNEPYNPNFTPDIPYPYYINSPPQDTPYNQNNTPNQVPDNGEEIKSKQNDNIYNQQKKGIRILLLLMSIIMIIFVIFEILYLNILGIYDKCIFIIIDEGAIFLCAILYLISLILSLKNNCVINPIFMTVFVLIVLIGGAILRSKGNMINNDSKFILKYYYLFFRLMSIRIAILFFAICPAPLTFVLQKNK